MAHFHQSVCRSHDPLCGYVRGLVPPVACRSPVVRLLDVPLPQCHGHLASVPQPAHLGRFCGFDLLHGFSSFLVCGTYSRSSHSSRPFQEQGQADHLRHARNGLAWFRSPLASLSVGLPVACRACYASCALRSHRREFRLRDCYRPWLAHHHFPALLRRRGHLLGFCHGHHHRHSPSQSLRPRGLHHHAPPRKHGQGHACDGTHRCLWLLL